MNPVTGPTPSIRAPIYQHPRLAVVRPCSEPKRQDSLPLGVRGDPIHYALASKARFPVALLVRRQTRRGEGVRLHDNPGLLRRDAGGSALLALVRGEARQSTGLGLVRHLRPPQMHQMWFRWMGRPAPKLGRDH